MYQHIGLYIPPLLLKAFCLPYQCAEISMRYVYP